MRQLDQSLCISCTGSGSTPAESEMERQLKGKSTCSQHSVGSRKEWLALDCQILTGLAPFLLSPLLLYTQFRYLVCIPSVCSIESDA